jgi:hypothetical protein
METRSIGTQTEEKYEEKKRKRENLENSEKNISTYWERNSNSRTKTKVLNYNENSENSEEEKKSDHEDDDYKPSKKKVKNTSKNVERIIKTCIPVNKIPTLMEEIKEELKENFENHDEYLMETFILNSAMNYSGMTENEFKEFVKTKILVEQIFKVDIENIY